MAGILGELLAVLAPPGDKPLGADDGGAADLKGNAVAGLDLQPGSLVGGSFYLGGVLKKRKADAHFGHGVGTAAQGPAEERLFGVGLALLLRHKQDDAAFFCQKVAFVGAVGQAADIRAGQKLVGALLYAEEVAACGQRNISAYLFFDKARRQGQAVAHAVVIKSLQHTAPPFSTSGLS